MRCYRKILHISYKDHVTNEEVRAKFQQAIGPHDDLLTIVKRRKLLCYGHVSRSSGLVKTIFQCTMKGRRRQGRQRKRWEDNIREWQAWSSLSPRGQWRTWKNGGNWLRNHLWCPDDPRGKEIDDDDDDDDDDERLAQAYLLCYNILTVSHFLAGAQRSSTQCPLSVECTTSLSSARVTRKHCLIALLHPGTLVRTTWPSSSNVRVGLMFRHMFRIKPFLGCSWI